MIWTYSLDARIHSLIVNSISKLWDADDIRKNWLYRQLLRGEPLSGNMYSVYFEQPELKLCFRSEHSSLDTFDFESGLGFEENIDNNLLKDYDSIFSRVTNAINNRSGTERDRSWTTTPVVALFKYAAEDSRLVINNLYTNSLKLLVILYCYNWVGDGDESYYPDGTPCDRAHTEEIEVYISLNDISNRDKIVKAIEDEIYDRESIGPSIDGYYMMDIEDIDIQIIGYTLEVCTLSKDKIHKLNSYGTQIGLGKSYRVDKEIVSDANIHSVYMLGKTGTQIARLLVLNILANDEINFEKLVESYRSPNSSFSKHEISRLDILVAYLRNHRHQVKQDWLKLFRKDNYPILYISEIDIQRASEVHKLIQRIGNQTRLLSEVMV